MADFCDPVEIPRLAVRGDNALVMGLGRGLTDVRVE